MMWDQIDAWWRLGETLLEAGVLTMDQAQADLDLDFGSDIQAIP